MHSLIEALLTLARLDGEAAPMKDQWEPVELDSVLVDAIESVEHLTIENQTRIQLDLPEVSTTPEGDVSFLVRGQRSLLVQLFVNLLSNAIHHSEQGGLVQCQLQEREESYVVEISDRGCGIGAEHLPHLFERFYRAEEHRSSRTGGVGLGLAICKAIVEQHKGQIGVKSEIGEGAVFTVELPRPV